jgi:hypothetical protein
MIAQAKAEEKVYEQFEHEECNQFEEWNSKFATSQVENYTPTPHSYTVKPIPVGNGSLDLSESTPIMKSKTIRTRPIAQSTAINCKPAESSSPNTLPFPNL